MLFVDLLLLFFLDFDLQLLDGLVDVFAVRDHLGESEHVLGRGGADVVHAYQTKFVELVLVLLLFFFLLNIVSLLLLFLLLFFCFVLRLDALLQVDHRVEPEVLI